MNLSVGIVGLPNVGKSTLFNALLKKQQALAANYPFATIEPNIGIVPVPDERLQKLAEITALEIHGYLGGVHPATPQESLLPPIKPATVQFVDIAGLVKGASEGAGLGNKFLSHIREVSIIAHVVRVFEDENIIKEGAVDPRSDYETINTELILADLATISKIKDQKSKIQIKYQKEAIDKLSEALNKGTPARDVILTQEEKEAVTGLFLLSQKPEIIVLNVTEDQYNPEGIRRVTEKYRQLLGSVIPTESQRVEGSVTSDRSDEIDFLTPGGSLGMTNENGDNMVVICAKIESDLSELTEEEQKQYLADLGLKESGLERLIKKAYHRLGLISFLTCGEKEVKAWTIKKSTDAQHAAGEIHTDFIKHFIKAEVVSYNEFVQFVGWKGSRDAGKSRQEGKDYIVADGDVIEFKIGK